MGFFEEKSLPRSARQIDRACIDEQDNNIMGGDIDRKNTQQYFCVEEIASFSLGGGWRSH